MNFNLIQTSGIIAFVLLCIIAFYFFQTKNQKSHNNILLSALLLVYAIMIVCSLILSSGINQSLFKLAHIGNQSAFLIGPLLYFHIKSQFNPDFKITKTTLTHGLPFVFVSLYLAVKFYTIPIPISCRANHILIGSIAFMHSLYYFKQSTDLLMQNGFSVLSPFKNKIESKSKCIPFLLYACFSIWLSKLLFFIVWDVSGHYQGCNELVNLYFLISFILITAFTYFVLLNPQAFTPIKKYKSSGLSKNKKLQYKKQLISLMEKDKVYLDPLISLNKLAKKMHIPDRYLSQILNETINMNFYDFINSYRIKDCIHYLSDTEHSKKTILEIAYEVGYNSKSTFNSSFVKFTGLTPKEFRKNQQIENPKFEPALCYN